MLSSRLRLAYCGITFGVLLFATIAALVLNGQTADLDRQILLAFRHPDLTPRGPYYLSGAIRDITALGSMTVLNIITIASTAFLALGRKHRTAMFLAGAVYGGMLLSTLLKDIFHRTRPDLVPHLTLVATYTFPSGHALLSSSTYFTIAAMLARTLPSQGLKAFCFTIAGFLTLIIGISRMYLGVHWPSDVLAGWAAGLTWALVCQLGWHRTQRDAINLDSSL